MAYSTKLVGNYILAMISRLEEPNSHMGGEHILSSRDVTQYSGKTKNIVKFGGHSPHPHKQIIPPRNVICSPALVTIVDDNCEIWFNILGIRPKSSAGGPCLYLVRSRKPLFVGNNEKLLIIFSYVNKG